jgi:ribonuclease G
MAMSAIDELLVAPEAGAPGGLRAIAIRRGRADDAALLEAGPEAVGAIHRGRVVRVVPGLRAAFVEIGAARPALLDIGRAPPETGSIVTVQIVERAQADKAARVSRRIALAGRWVVALAGGRGIAWSRRADVDRAKTLAAGLRTPPRAGLLLRRGAEDAGLVAAEATVLGEQAAAIASDDGPPRCIAPADPIAALFAEFASGAIGTIAVGDGVLARKIAAFAMARHPDLAARVSAADADVLERHGASEALSDTPVVALAGGGRIAIERTAALVAIDVDSGAAAGRDAIAATNRAAAAEAARQMRLRDLGGLIVIDFIRMDSDKTGDPNARRGLHALLEREVARDRRPVDVLGFTAGGVCEVVRGRVGGG